MHWSEFTLRLLAFNRVQEREEYRLRRLAWVNTLAPHLDPKGLKNKKESSLWKIGNESKPKKQEIPKAQQDYALKLAADYYNIKNNITNG